MGKGFNNYMCKKFFHPASRDNLKRVWMAEQKADSYKKKQEELRVQYEKEQDLYTNKAMLSKESKDKLSVNFMYEPPPGTKKEREREDDEPEYKFEWQRKFNAPREDYCKGDSEIRDQPFGIQVRNVRCIKCHKWGHINTDKECPMYNQSSSIDQSGCSMDPLLLVQQMREDGLAMKQSALGLHLAATEHMPESDDDSKLKASEIDLLKSLSKKQKQKLLKKFIKLEKSAKKKKKKAKKSSKRESKEFDNGRERKRHKKQKERDMSRKSKVIEHESSSSTSSDTSSDSDDSSKVHYKKLKHKMKTSRNSKSAKQESLSDSSSDSDSEHERKHGSKDKTQEADFRRKKIKRERSSSCSDDESEIEFKKMKSSHYHSKGEHSKYDSMKELEWKVKRESDCNGTKYHDDHGSDSSHKIGKRSDSSDDHGHKSYGSADFKNHKQRPSREDNKSKSSRTAEENSKHKKLFDGKQYKKSSNGYHSTVYRRR